MCTLPSDATFSSRLLLPMQMILSTRFLSLQESKMKSQLDQFESGLTNQGASSAGGVATDLASLLRGYIFRTSPCPCNKMESVLLVCLLLLYSIPSPHQLQLTPEGTSMCVHACVCLVYMSTFCTFGSVHMLCMPVSVCACVCLSL